MCSVRVAEDHAFGRTWATRHGLSESWKYDNRERFVSEGAGTGCTAGAGTCTVTKYGASVTYFANGNVMSANDTANGNWVYTYDDFNRLVSSTGGPNNYSYAYAYDRFGNKWKQTLNGGCTAGTSFCIGFDANNRMTNLVQTYDAAGNVLSDSMHTYAYDAENRLDSVDRGATTYFYDAAGRRLERRTNGSVTRDWYYNRDGTMLIEIAPPYPLYQELYAAGMHIATRTLNNAQNGTDTYFHHVDWLGTERARTDWAGNLCETVASLAFGDGQNFSSTCAEGDGSPMHFTGKERDGESNLDYSIHRHYTSAMGRFMQPDPAGMMAVDIGDPQTLNRYAYVDNNPLAFIDPFGLDCVYLNDSGTGIEKNGIDQHSSSGECGKTGGYWVEGTVTNVNIDANATTISLTGTTNGANTTNASYQQNVTISVGHYLDTFWNPAGHIAFGIGNGQRYGLFPRSDWQFMKYAISRRLTGHVGGGPGVPGTVRVQVGGSLLELARVPATGMQAQMIQGAINQSMQNPPNYDVNGAPPTCDCASWPQLILGDAGINAGRPTQDPGTLINQLNSLYPPEQQ